MNVLGEPDQDEEAAQALGGGLSFLITEPRRERKAGEEVGFCPISCLFFAVSKNINETFLR